jgi:hypothetical protein
MKFLPLLLLPYCIVSLQLNIHLPLRKVNESWEFDLCPYNAALEANLALRQVSESEQLDFFSHHSPHITMFLSDFDTSVKNESQVLEEITTILQEVVANHSQIMCQVAWPTDAVHVAGAYSMYAVPRNACLQKLSDEIVQALNPYITKPQVIPEWVYNLPPLKRWRKIYMIQKYGSPNVFGEYEPHVTVGYDEGSSVQSRREVLQGIPPTQLECTGLLTDVAIAKVGPIGAVLQNSVLSTVRLQAPAAEDE